MVGEEEWEGLLRLFRLSWGGFGLLGNSAGIERLGRSITGRLLQAPPSANCGPPGAWCQKARTRKRAALSVCCAARVRNV